LSAPRAAQDERHASAASQAADDEDRDLLEVLDLPLHGLEDPERLLVGLQPSTEPAIQSPRPSVLRGQGRLHSAILDDDELPVLAVRARWRFESELETSKNDTVVDGIGQDAADCSLGEHRLGERHVQASLGYAWIAGWIEPLVHARASRMLSADGTSRPASPEAGEQVQLSSPGISVSIASTEYLFAMKGAAARIEGIQRTFA
jgi:hypothetical protein